MMDSSVIRNGTTRMQYALTVYDILKAIYDNLMYWKNMTSAKPRM